MTQRVLPIIDIAPFFAGDAQGRDAVAVEVDCACREIGFFLICGHGVPSAMIERTMALATAFFELPLAEKLKIKLPAPDISRGYTPLGEESLSYGLGEAAPGDLKEMVDIGPVDVPDDDYYRRPEAGNHFHPNLWPKQPPELRQHFSDYYRRMNRLADDIMGIFAHALALPADFFTDKLDKNLSALRIIRYPEQPQRPQPNQLRCGAHSDYGTLTILYSSPGVSGLQVMHRDGRWLDVVPVDGCFIVNIGDAMQVWTNDRWVSTLHRVVNPPPEQASSHRRQSAVFFHQPNYDAVIETLASCVDDQHPGHYAPLTFGEHWMRKWMATKVADE